MRLGMRWNHEKKSSQISPINSPERDETKMGNYTVAITENRVESQQKKGEKENRT